MPVPVPVPVPASVRDRSSIAVPVRLDRREAADFVTRQVWLGAVRDGSDVARPSPHRHAMHCAQCRADVRPCSPLLFPVCVGDGLTGRVGDFMPREKRQLSSLIWTCIRCHKPSMRVRRLHACGIDLPPFGKNAWLDYIQVERKHVSMSAFQECILTGLYLSRSRMQRARRSSKQRPAELASNKRGVVPCSYQVHRVKYSIYCVLSQPKARDRDLKAGPSPILK
jgi:hypothetical protein